MEYTTIVCVEITTARVLTPKETMEAARLVSQCTKAAKYLAKCGADPCVNDYWVHESDGEDENA